MLSKKSYSAYKGQWKKLWKARTVVRPLNEGGCPACKVVPLALGYNIPLYIEYCHMLCPIDYSYLNVKGVGFKTCKSANSRFNAWRESGRGVDQALNILNNTTWLTYEQYCDKVQKYNFSGVTV